MIDGELTMSERHHLIEFARAMVDRARQAGAASSETEEALFSIPLQEDLNPQALIELLCQYRRFFDKVRSALTQELDSVLMAVERLETELSLLRGEVQGLREERRELMSRVKQTERNLGAAAEEFTRQISAQVSSLTERFAAYLNGADYAPAVIESSSRPGPEDDDHSRTRTAPVELRQASLPASITRGVNGVSQLASANPASANSVAYSLHGGGPLRFIRALNRRRALRRPEKKAVALGDKARDAHDWSTAVGFYRKALDIDPNNGPIWVQYGHALKESGNRADAEIAYRKSIELESEVADTHLQLGHVLKLQGRLGAAAAAYLRALALDPHLDDARRELLGLGWTQFRIQQALGNS